MAKRTLKARDVERLENTSLASALVGGIAMLGTSRDGLVAPHMHAAEACDGITCIGVSCIGYCVTVCNTAAATANTHSLVCVGTCAGITDVPDVPTAAGCVPPVASRLCMPTADGCGGTMQGGHACN